MCRKAESHQLPSQWIKFLQHLLRVANGVCDALSFLLFFNCVLCVCVCVCVFICMYGIVLDAVQTGKQPPKDHKELPISNYSHLSVYVELHTRLIAAHDRTQTQVLSEAEDLVEQLRLAVFQALGTLVRAVGRCAAAFAVEIVSALAKHFQVSRAAPALSWCLLQTFMAVFHPSKPVTGGDSGGAKQQLQQSTMVGNSNELLGLITRSPSIPPHQSTTMRGSLLNLPYRMRETQQADFFAQVKLPTSIEQAELKIRQSKKMIRSFEPMVVWAMHSYRITHSISAQCSTLLLLTQLVGLLFCVFFVCVCLFVCLFVCVFVNKVIHIQIRFGVDFSRLDADHNFLCYVNNQILGKRSYLSHPPLILPRIFEFLTALAITRRFKSPVWFCCFISFCCSLSHTTATYSGNASSINIMCILFTILVVGGFIVTFHQYIRF